MKTTFSRLLLTILLGTSLALLALFAAYWQTGIAASLTEPTSAPQLTLRYVATTGSDTTDCSNSANPCATIQYAVDQSSAGDEVRVAGGEYTGVNNYGGLSQIVYISKTVTIRGGYTITNWLIPDLELNPTTLNAQQLGRGLFVVNAAGVVLEYLRVVNGGTYYGGGIGALYSDVMINYCWIEGNTSAGVGADGSTVILHGNVITDNIGSHGVGGHFSTVTMTQNTVSGNILTYPSSSGGGINIQYGRAYLSGNIVTNNSSTWTGGGILLANNSETLVMSNTIANNIAYDNGGGLIVGATTGSDVIIGNTIMGNSTEGFGGGAFLVGSDITFIHNLVMNNQSTATRSGGVYIGGNGLLAYNDIRGNYSGYDGGGVTAVAYGAGNQISLIGNSIISNTASSQGGGVVAESGNEGLVSLMNNIIADNHIVQSGSWHSGSGVFVRGVATLLHSPIANNQGGNGAGVMLQWNDTANLVDNIIISHTVGISVSANSTANLNATLWGNDTDWTGPGTITTGTINLWGNPTFIDPASGDYHISPTSIARDAGIDTGITTDIDGNPRPQGTGFDIGADEVLALYLPIGIVQVQGRSDHSGAIVTAWSGSTVVATTTTDISGAYALVVPDGVYNITIEMPLYLDAVKTNVFISNTSLTAITPVTLKGGDANDSDKINILDLSLIGAHYGLTCADPGWDARADINHDCLVNLLDLTLAAGNFGKTSPVPW